MVENFKEFYNSQPKKEKKFPFQNFFSKLGKNFERFLIWEKNFEKGTFFLF